MSILPNIGINWNILYALTKLQVHLHNYIPHSGDSEAGTFG